MKLSRRELAAAATGIALATKVFAQPAGSVPTASEQATAARDANRRAAETLAKFEIPMSTEPAFRFKA